MLAGGIVTDVEITLRDGGGEGGKGAAKGVDASGSSAGDGAGDALGLFAASAFVNQDVSAAGGERDELLFEGIGNPLRRVLTDAKAHGDEGTRRKLDGIGGLGRDPRRGAFHPKSAVSPLGGEQRQGILRLRSERAAFKKTIILFRTDGQEAELGEAGIGIDDEGVRLREEALQIGPERQAIGNAA